MPTGRMTSPPLRLRQRVVALAAAVCVGTPLLAIPNQASAAPATAAPAAADPAVITEWNAIAVRTILTEGITPIPSSPLYFGFVHVAMHDAVVAVEGGYEPLFGPGRSRLTRRASTEVAAATAAHRVLRHYFPASAPQLEADYAAALADAPAGLAKVLGRVVGEVAAASLIHARRDDGRDAAITLDVEPAPGVWRPTPDAFAPMLVPWLGFVEPLTLQSPTQFDLPGPDPIDSAAYAQDYAEVKAFGAKVGSSRSAAQTETALFFSANVVLQYYEGLREVVAREGMGIVESARSFALLGTSLADVAIACWRAKYDFAYWRPITAIREGDTDDNPATDPDPAWTSLVPTPPYGDYVSGHACFTGAASGALVYLLGTEAIDLQMVSPVTGTTRRYATAAELDEDTMNARIWLGLHFRKAMTDGNQLGHDVADWVAAHAFQPTH